MNQLVKFYHCPKMIWAKKWVIDINVQNQGFLMMSKSKSNLKIFYFKSKFKFFQKKQNKKYWKYGKIRSKWEDLKNMGGWTACNSYELPAIVDSGLLILLSADILESHKQVKMMGQFFTQNLAVLANTRAPAAKLTRRM